MATSTSYYGNGMIDHVVGASSEYLAICESCQLRGNCEGN